MQKGTSPKAAILGMPRTLTKSNAVKISAIITNNETPTVPIHPKRLSIQTKQAKKSVKHP